MCQLLWKCSLVYSSKYKIHNQNSRLDSCAVVVLYIMLYLLWEVLRSVCMIASV